MNRADSDQLVAFAGQLLEEPVMLQSHLHSDLGFYLFEVNPFLF